MFVFLLGEPHDSGAHAFGMKDCTVTESPASGLQGVSYVTGIQVLMLLQMSSQIGNRSIKLGRGTRREHQQTIFSTAARPRQPWSFFKNHMCIGAANAEGADTRMTNLAV